MNDLFGGAGVYESSPKNSLSSWLHVPATARLARRAPEKKDPQNDSHENQGKTIGNRPGFFQGKTIGNRPGFFVFSTEQNRPGFFRFFLRRSTEAPSPVIPSRATLVKL